MDTNEAVERVKWAEAYGAGEACKLFDRTDKVIVGMKASDSVKIGLSSLVTGVIAENLIAATFGTIQENVGTESAYGWLSKVMDGIASKAKSLSKVKDVRINLVVVEE